jgi:hypothetical protein
VIYFSPATAEKFASLIGELRDEACLKPLPFGLDVRGNWDGVSMLD